MKEFKKLVDCLNRQIFELEALCRLKDARISDLEKRLAEAERKGITSKVATTGLVQESVCQHEYENATWLSTQPPHCLKCGQQAQSIQVTVSGETTSTEWR